MCTQPDAVPTPSKRLATTIRRDPEWMQDGVCQYTDPELFYPVTGRPAVSPRRICTSCPSNSGARNGPLPSATTTASGVASPPASEKRWLGPSGHGRPPPGCRAPATGGIPLALQTAYFEGRSEVSA